MASASARALDAAALSDMADWTEEEELDLVRGGLKGLSVGPLEAD